MSKHNVNLYESKSPMELELATKLANAFSLGTTPEGAELFQGKIYHTTVKVAPLHELLPNHCWIITNKYDPRVSNKI